MAIRVVLHRYTWGTTPTTYRYTGQRQEAALGLYFYNARWYDPALGRFTQPDTIVPEPGNPQSLNRFAYVRNNPLRYVDPSGHKLIAGVADEGGNDEEDDNAPPPPAGGGISIVPGAVCPPSPHAPHGAVQNWAIATGWAIMKDVPIAGASPTDPGNPSRWGCVDLVNAQGECYEVTTEKECPKARKLAQLNRYKNAGCSPAPFIPCQTFDATPYGLPGYEITVKSYEEEDKQGLLCYSYSPRRQQHVVPELAPQDVRERERQMERGLQVAPVAVPAIPAWVPPLASGVVIMGGVYLMARGGGLMKVAVEFR